MLCLSSGGDINALWNTLNPASQDLGDKPQADKGVGGFNGEYSSLLVSTSQGFLISYVYFV